MVVPRRRNGLRASSRSTPSGPSGPAARSRSRASSRAGSGPSCPSAVLAVEIVVFIGLVAAGALDAWPGWLGGVLWRRVVRHARAPRATCPRHAPSGRGGAAWRPERADSGRRHAAAVHRGTRRAVRPGRRPPPRARRLPTFRSTAGRAGPRAAAGRCLGNGRSCEPGPSVDASSRLARLGVCRRELPAQPARDVPGPSRGCEARAGLGARARGRSRRRSPTSSRSPAAPRARTSRRSPHSRRTSPSTSPASSRPTPRCRRASPSTASMTSRTVPDGSVATAWAGSSSGSS